MQIVTEWQIVNEWRLTKKLTLDTYSETICFQYKGCKNEKKCFTIKKTAVVFAPDLVWFSTD